MKSILAFLFIALCFSSFVLAHDLETLKKFQAFEAKFNKQYASPAERNSRLDIFVQNLQKVEEMNAAHGTPVFGVSKFMDMSTEEFSSKYLNLRVPEKMPEQPITIAPQPEANVTVWDWGVNKTGIITPVKNQEQCGSCWAFSATESTESAWGLAGHAIEPLAPQQIVDCDVGGTDDGCNGGYPYDAFDYIIKAGGLEAESSYPYMGVDGRCKFQSSLVVSNISSWNWVSQKATTETTNMFNYVATTGPVSVCVDAAPWQFYVGGVLKHCGNIVDHAVQVTGFGVQTGLNVWNVRNSWGADWGEKGYIWLERGSNLCAIATIVTAAVAK